MEIDRVNNQIIMIQKKMKEVENAKKESNMDCIYFDILESESLELEKQLDLETSRLNDLLKLQDYQDSCSHVFVDDLIDISPDKSKLIKYCTHCLFTPSEDSK